MVRVNTGYLWAPAGLNLSKASVETWSISFRKRSIVSYYRTYASLTGGNLHVYLRIFPIGGDGISIASLTPLYLHNAESEITNITKQRRKRADLDMKIRDSFPTVQPTVSGYTGTNPRIQNHSPRFLIQPVQRKHESPRQPNDEGRWARSDQNGSSNEIVSISRQDPSTELSYRGHYS
jgi:hypothetical protein